MAPLIEPVNLTVELPKLGRADAPGGGYPLSLDRVQNFAWAQDVFSADELNAIVHIGTSIEIDRAQTGAGLQTSKETRDSFVSWMFPNDVTGWVFNKLAAAIIGMNEQYFGFDLTCMEQGLQFTQYSAPGEHYDWHIDRGNNYGIRKLSLSMQLSDPENYEGGDLELWFGGKDEEIIKAPRERGMIMFFPSWAMHRVTPVTQGTRHSLVCWVSGPSFK